MRVAYPSFTGAFSYSLEASSDQGTKPFVANDQIKNGDDIVVILGCFVYRSLGMDRHTVFCFYYDKVTDRSHLPYCPVG